MRTALLLSLLAALALPASAGAAASFGSDVTQEPSADGHCVAYPCSLVTQAGTGGTAGTAAPFDGVLVRVRLAYRGDGASGSFRVLRGAGPALLNVAPELPFSVPASAATQVFSFDVAHPLRRGDRVGLAADASFGDDAYAVVGGQRACQLRQAGTAGADGAHAPGSSAEYVTTACELLVEGTVERDADRDGRGDESQDADDDGDRVPDVDERRRGTSTLDLDSDDDGLSDGREPRLGLDPRRADTDRDRLPDGLELGLRRGLADPPGPVRGTSARRFRRDRDPRTRTSALRADTDRDGVIDGREDRDRDGRRDRGETDPRRRDARR